MRACVLFVIVFLAAVQCHEDLEPLFEAFPNGDLSAFSELPKEAFVNEDIPVYAPPLTACPSIPTPPDTNNVNNLRPGNIKVVMGMGDSIIAGMSAKDTLLINLKEYRGLSFCIGADPTINTMPNILKQFSPDLIGISTGIGQRTMLTNGLNGAVSGGINKDMLGQAQWLVSQLNANSKINIHTDWKVLTIWIGSNNLCAVCNNAAANDGNNFQTELMNALNYLIANVPRLLVNLIANLDISSLYNIGGGGCSQLHSFECACVGTSDANKRAAVSATAKDYVKRAYAIADMFNARNKIDFAVVVQPFLENNTISERSLLSAADCFHPSAAGHALASTALWNNMLTPAAQKKKAWNAADQPICPTANSIFPTK